MVLKKILVIRFSSFGDIVQASTVNVALRKQFPESEIIWLTKKAFSSLLEADPNLNKVITLDSFTGLISLFKWIKTQRFCFIYDAHYSLRSNLIYILSKIFGTTAQWARRQKVSMEKVSTI